MLLKQIQLFFQKLFPKVSPPDLSKVKIAKKEKDCTKTEFEFSKIIVVVSFTLAIICTLWFFILTTLQIDTGAMADVVNELIRDVINVAFVYYLYNGWLKNSRNKYGIDVNGIPYAIQTKYNNVFGSTEPKTSKENNHTTDGEEKPIG